MGAQVGAQVGERQRVSPTGGPRRGLTDREAPAWSLRRAATLTAAAGAAHAGLFLLSFWLVAGTPGARASDAEIAAFYGSGERRRLILAGLYLMPFAGIAFLWFVVALRMWISGSARREHVVLSNVQLVSGILFIALFFGAAAATASTAASVEFSSGGVDPVVARQLPQYGNALLFVFAMRMAAMFVFTTSNIGRNAGILPRWFVLAGFAVGLFLLLSATFSALLVLVFPVWVFVLSGFLLLQARRIPADAVIPDAAAPAGAPRAGGAARRR
jgi:hypothetical protein